MSLDSFDGGRHLPPSKAETCVCSAIAGGGACESASFIQAMQTRFGDCQIPSSVHFDRWANQLPLNNFFYTQKGPEGLILNQ